MKHELDLLHEILTRANAPVGPGIVFREALDEGAVVNERPVFDEPRVLTHGIALDFRSGGRRAPRVVSVRSEPALVMAWFDWTALEKDFSGYWKIRVRLRLKEVTPAVVRQLRKLADPVRFDVEIDGAREQYVSYRVRLVVTQFDVRPEQIDLGPVRDLSRQFIDAERGGYIRIPALGEHKYPTRLHGRKRGEWFAMSPGVYDVLLEDEDGNTIEPPRRLVVPDEQVRELVVHSSSTRALRLNVYSTVDWIQVWPRSILVGGPEPEDASCTVWVRAAPTADTPNGEVHGEVVLSPAGTADGATPDSEHNLFRVPVRALVQHDAWRMRVAEWACSIEDGQGRDPRLRVVIGRVRRGKGRLDFQIEGELLDDPVRVLTRPEDVGDGFVVDVPVSWERLLRAGRGPHRFWVSNANERVANREQREFQVSADVHRLVIDRDRVRVRVPLGGRRRVNLAVFRTDGLVACPEVEQVELDEGYPGAPQIELVRPQRSERTEVLATAPDPLRWRSGWIPACLEVRAPRAGVVAGSGRFRVWIRDGDPQCVASVELLVEFVEPALHVGAERALVLEATDQREYVQIDLKVENREPRTVYVTTVTIARCGGQSVALAVPRRWASVRPGSVRKLSLRGWIPRLKAIRGGLVDLTFGFLDLCVHLDDGTELAPVRIDESRSAPLDT